jgi:3-phytase
MRIATVAGVVAFTTAGCGVAGSQRDADSPRVVAAKAVVEEVFITPFDTIDNVDSPAIYHAGDTHWVLASAKTTNAVLVYDATMGALMRRVGTSGSAGGQLRRPNGVAVVDSLLFVVERDNARVQVFQLPGFAPLGTFGSPELRKPYGIAWYNDGPASWVVFVTDNYETPDEGIPPDRELGARVKQYAIGLREGRLTSRLTRAFGDTNPEGALRTVESIAVDLQLGRLLVAEETEVDSHIKVYDLEGRFTGRIVGRGLFPQQAEGIALWTCPDSSGYVIATDQGESINNFHAFDRLTLEHVGSWTGKQTRLTDGIALTQAAFGRFPSGALYASHLDASVTAQSWADVAAAVGLRRDCVR